MTVEGHDIEARDGIRLRLWEQPSPNAQRAVLFVHGATYASRAVFAPRGAPEYSWLRAATDADTVGFALDIRGYGGSERPPAMETTPDDTEPPVRADIAAADLHDAVTTIHERLDIPVHLVGSSWGTIIVGRFMTTADASSIVSVALHAPVFQPSTDLLEGFDLGEPPQAYRTISRTEARSRWDEQLPATTPATYRGGDAEADPVFESFWRTLADSGQGSDEDTIVAPNGTLVDLTTAVEGEQLYDPTAIDASTLVIRGSLDPTSTRADAIGLYDALSVPGDESAYIEIEGGTHFIHLERRRSALYDAVQCFQERH